MKKKSLRKDTKRNEHRKQRMNDELKGLKLFGWMITWKGDQRGRTYPFTDVMQALDSAGFKAEEVASEFTPRNAFKRACKKMEADRSIDEVRNDNDQLVFQFTRKYLDRHKDMMNFSPETKVTLNLITGKIKCKDPKMQQLAQDKLNECTEARTTSDVTRIIQRLFKSEADIITFQEKCYIVPDEVSGFIDEVEKFTDKLHIRLDRLPIPKGSSHGDRAIAEAFNDHIEAMIEEHRDACSKFTIYSNEKTMKTHVDKIDQTRITIEAYASCLGDRVKKLIATVEEEKKALKQKINHLVKEKENAPEAPKGVDKFDCRLGTRAAKINAVIGSKPKSAKEIQEEAGYAAQISTHLRKMLQKGFIVKTPEGYKESTQTRKKK